MKHWKGTLHGFGFGTHAAGIKFAPSSKSFSDPKAFLAAVETHARLTGPLEDPEARRLSR
jgi:hypothetical protein